MVFQISWEIPEDSKIASTTWDGFYLDWLHGFFDNHAYTDDDNS
jgi:hypothetical protein